MKLIHLVGCDEVMMPRRGIVIEGDTPEYCRKHGHRVPSLYKRAEVIHFIWHVTLGKPREFRVDYDTRTTVAKPMYWVRLSVFHPRFLRGWNWKWNRLRMMVKLRWGVQPSE